MNREQSRRFDELALQLEKDFLTDTQRIAQLRRLGEKGEDPVVCRALSGYFKYPRAPEHRYEGKYVGDYKLLELIGEGGSGAVYRARERASVDSGDSIQRDVAVKLVHPRYSSEGQKTFFIEEIKLYYKKLGNPPHTIPHEGMDWTF
jgi:serine/threonine protein kinase